MKLLPENQDKYAQEAGPNCLRSFRAKAPNKRYCNQLIYVHKYTGISPKPLKSFLVNLLSSMWNCFPTPLSVTTSLNQRQWETVGKHCSCIKSRISLSYYKTYYIYPLLVFLLAREVQRGWGTEVQWVTRAYLQLQFLSSNVVSIQRWGTNIFYGNHSPVPKLALPAVQCVLHRELLGSETWLWKLGVTAPVECMDLEVIVPKDLKPKGIILVLKTPIIYLPH